MRNGKGIFMLMLILILLLLCLCAWLWHGNVKKSGEIAALREELRKYRAPVHAPGIPAGFTYLAIGNSITLHGKCSYWWDDRRGMAASEPEKDYVHRVAAHLEKLHGKVTWSAFNFAAWEVQAHDRAEFLPMLEKHFVPVPDLVTVQLGENARDCTTLPGDFTELLQWIRARAPKAKIIVAGDLWSAEKSAVKRAAAEKCGCAFAEMELLSSKPEYQCGIGTMVCDDRGGMHRVEHEGVATHPGDEGMKRIADEIIRLL